MAAVRIIILLVAVSCVCVALRVNRPEMAMVVSMTAGVIALLLSMEDIRVSAQLIEELSERAEMSSDAVGMLLRAAGLCLISEFGAAVCRDSGEGALAVRIEAASRFALAAMAAPVLVTMVERILFLLQ